VIGTVDPSASEAAAVRWLDALPESHALTEGVPGAVVDARPFGTPERLREASPEFAATLLGD
jgi:hypothetical protein